MSPVENRLQARKYYQTHRSEIITHKLLRDCRLGGRVPRAATISKHQLPITELVAAFNMWQRSHALSETGRTKRGLRLERTLAELEARDDGVSSDWLQEMS